MTRPLFEHWIAKEGMRVLRSWYTYQLRHLLDQDNRQRCDAATLFELPPGQ
jgi:hypothetical protein